MGVVACIFSLMMIKLCKKSWLSNNELVLVILFLIALWPLAVCMWIGIFIFAVLDGLDIFVDWLKNWLSK